MWSMWNAPSDRDYYGDDGLEEFDPPEPGCDICGATDDQAHEEWCGTERAQARLPLEPVTTTLALLILVLIGWFSASQLWEGLP